VLGAHLGVVAVRLDLYNRARNDAANTYECPAREVGGEIGFKHPCAAKNARGCGIAVMTPRRLLHRLRFWRGWERELPAEIDRRLRPLEEAGEKQVILDIWVLRELLNRLPRMAAERPTRLTEEASDELIAEAKDELAMLREKAKGRRLRKEEIDPVIADLQRLTGWSEATVVDRLNLSKKKR
jgi:hypothetical protein